MAAPPSSPSLARQYESRLWSPSRRARDASRSNKRPKPGSARRGRGPPKTPPRTPKRVYSDRFIPSRSTSLLESGFSLLDDAESSNGKEDVNTHSLLLRTELLGPGTLTPTRNTTAASGAGAGAGAGGGSAPRSQGRRRTSTHSVGSPSPSRNIFRFQQEREKVQTNLVKQFSLSPLGPASERLLASPRRPPRKIAEAPYKVLDAPALQDDFYLNLVDWSSENVLAVGLASSVYLWSAATSKVTRLVDLPANDCVTSVSWTQRGTYLAVGTNKGDVQLFDASACKKIRSFEGHTLRVGAMAWSKYRLATGGRDRGVFLRDVRASEPFFKRLSGHREEICGLKWSYDDQHLASGGNDNKLMVWNAASQLVVHKFCDHTAAVKALAWSPHQTGLLASGGGTADRTIRFWNTTTGTALRTVDTGSQVCNLGWSKSVDEVVSTHGYSLNQIIVWKYPTMEKVATLSGHTFRVLYMAMSPNGQTIVTGAGDETLRFWNVFPPAKTTGHTSRSRLLPGGPSIR